MAYERSRVKNNGHDFAFDQIGLLAIVELQQFTDIWYPAAVMSRTESNGRKLPRQHILEFFRCFPLTPHHKFPFCLWTSYDLVIWCLKLVVVAGFLTVFCLHSIEKFQMRRACKDRHSVPHARGK
jgi:hypothetical protein